MDKIEHIKLDYEEHLCSFTASIFMCPLPPMQYALYIVLCEIWKGRSENGLYPSEITLTMEEIKRRIDVTTSLITKNIINLMEKKLMGNYKTEVLGMIKLTIRPYPGSPDHESYFDVQEGKNINIAQNIGGNNHQTINEYQKEVEHLKELLAEKERLIQVLLNNK